MKPSVEGTVRRLMELGAPSLLVQLALGVSAPDLLKYEFQEPREFYTLVTDYPDDMPFEDCLVPLWETNGESITAYVDNETPMVIRYYYEDASAKYEVVGHTIMEAIEKTIVWFLEECEFDSNRVVAAARACEHPSVEEFVRRRKVSE